MVYFQILLFIVSISIACAEPPYKPSGWRPLGHQFPLPTEFRPNYSPLRGMPLIDDQYGPPRKEYGPPKDEYGLPKHGYVPTKQEYDFPDTYSTIPIQEPPIHSPPRNWQNIESTLSWRKPEEKVKPNYVWNKNQADNSNSDESSKDDSIEQEAQRVLEQIRQYRIKNSVRNGQVIPSNFDTPEYKQRYQVRTNRNHNSYKHGNDNFNKKHEAFRTQRLQEMRDEEQNVYEDNSGYAPKMQQFPRTKYGTPGYTTPTPEEIPDSTTPYPEMTTEVSSIFIFTFHIHFIH